MNAIFLGFVGDVGDTSVPGNAPASLPEVPNNGDGVFPSAFGPFLGGTTWNETVTKAIYPIGHLSLSHLHRDTASLVSKILSTPGGLFKPLIPGADNGFLAGATYCWNVDLSDSLKSGDVNFAHEYASVLAPTINTYKYVTGLIGSVGPSASALQTLDYSALTPDNMVFFGPWSNKNVVLGDGNNIFIASPTMNYFTFTVDQQSHGLFEKDRGKIFTYIFYPSSQGDYQSNTITAGNGNNIIYFDSSDKLITTGNGNNVFLPSFGSFNWAANWLVTPTATPGTHFTLWTNDPSGSTSLFTPISSADIQKNGSNNEENQYAYIRAFDGQTNGGGKPGIGTQTGQASYQGSTIWGGSDGGKNNHIGGQTIIGGTGDDTFFGVDPRFYEQIPIGVTGGIRSAYSFDSSLNSPNARFNNTNFETINLYGGGGNDVFYLGDPTQITPNKFTGSFSYIISTSHNKYTNYIDKQSLGFGYNPSGSSVNVNLTENYQTYTTNYSSITSGSSSSIKANSGLDSAKFGLGLEGSASKIAGTLEKLGKLSEGAASFVKNTLPVIDMGITIASTVIDIIKFIPGVISEPAPPQKLTQTMIKNPLGTWQKAININDWDPYDLINISVTPNISNDPKKPADNIDRWSSVSFVTKPYDNGSNTENGVYIQSRIGDTVQDLFRIEGLGAPTFGYQSYNFQTGKYQQIDQNNLAYFGTLANGSAGANTIKNYTSGNGMVFSSENPNTPSLFGSAGSYMFYWKDGSNPNTPIYTGNLNSREQASQITLKFDSMSLGYYWDTKFILPDGVSTVDATNFTADQLNASLVPDVINSKLWFNTGTAWKYHTYADFNTITQAYEASLLARTYYQVINDGKTIITTDQQNTNNLVAGLKLLGNVMPDLGKLDQTSTTNSALKLMSLMQITAVKSNGNGVDVFFTSNSSSQGSSEITINLANGKPTVSNAKVLNSAQTHALEVQFNLDINGNGVVGTPAINTYSTTKNDAFVAGLYSSVLNRATPDPEGQQFWVTALNNGQSKVNVISSFLKSSEAHSKLATDAHFINFSYQQLLGRSPEATGGSFWLNQIKNGASHDTVIDAIASSSELAQLVGSLKIA